MRTIRVRTVTLSGLWRSLLLLVVGSASAVAAEVHVVAPSAPGSGWDQVARAMQGALATSGGPSTIAVENVPGGNGAVGLGRFLADGSDGDILVTGLTMLDAVLAKHSTDLDRMTPLARLCLEYYAIAVPANSPLKSFDDVKAALQTEPSKISWAGGPVGGIDHAATALLAMASGVAPVALNYVAFVSTGDAVAAIAEGKVTAAFLSTVELETAIKSEKLRVLAVASRTRLPNVAAPTLQEGGLDLEFANWRGLLARPDVSPAGRQELETLVAGLVATPAWQDMLASRGWQDGYLEPAAFSAFIKTETVRIKAALKATGFLRPDAN